MSRITGLILTVVFVTLSSLTTNIIWTMTGWVVLIQVIVTFLIGSIGEHYVSGKGYYHYTEQNGLFIGRVALWIPFMWVFVVQSFLILPLVLGFSEIESIALSGTLGFVVDFIFVEPYFSRKKKFWSWQNVEKGFFSFLPERLNRFTAPPGNYVVWYGFPIIMNMLLGVLTIHSISLF